MPGFCGRDNGHKALCPLSDNSTEGPADPDSTASSAQIRRCYHDSTAVPPPSIKPALSDKLPSLLMSRASQFSMLSQTHSMYSSVS